MSKMRPDYFGRKEAYSVALELVAVLTAEAVDLLHGVRSCLSLLGCLTDLSDSVLEDLVQFHKLGELVLDQFAIIDWSRHLVVSGA